VTSISLAAVFFNVLSGTIAYGWMGRVDYRAGLMFSLATMPGSIAGAFTIEFISRQLFDLIFGVLVLIVAGLILRRSPALSNPGAQSELPEQRSGYVTHSVTDVHGHQYTYSYSLSFGLLLSFGIGFLSTLLGSGGGALMVPALIYLFHFPLPIATATSQFMLTIITLTGTIVHIVTGSFTRGYRRTFFLTIGMLLGAQVGAWLSERIQGAGIIRLLALALVIVGLRLLWSGW